MISPGDVGGVIDDRFEIIEEIGKGGMGTVLRVKDLTSNQDVARKYCHENVEIAVQRFARETRFAAGLDHKHVITVLHHNLNHEPPYFTMPMAERSVAEEIRRKLLDENEALSAFNQMCLGVQAIHNAGGIHRDIKPDNALRMPGETVVISDFGLVKLDPRDTTTLTPTVAILGTRRYSAPEQLAGESRDVDFRTDVYPLGKVLYEMITGKSPVVVTEEGVPPGIAYIVHRATQQTPDQRYQTVDELMDAVSDYIASKTSPHRVFEDALQAASMQLERGHYDARNLETFFSVLAQFGDDPETLLEQFDRIPNRLLSVMASDFSNNLLSVLRAYVNAIDSVVAGCNFAYAEKVAKKMKVVFDGSDDPTVKALAVRATLIAAVDLNRFAAMSVFDSLILAVQRTEDAMAVASILREEMSRYSHLAERVPKPRLHATIRAICEEAKGE